jgi:hypothetical protein
MKAGILLTGVGLVAVLALSCASRSRYNPHAVATTPSNIKGSWIGYDQDCLLFYRLMFADEGKGLCVALFVDDTADVHRIKRWEFKDRDLVLDLLPATAGAERISMKVVAVDQREMRVEVSGGERSWSHQMILHREDDILRRTKIVEGIAKRTERQRPAAATTF